MISDHSDAGAFLEVEAGAELPRTVRLQLPDPRIEIVAEVRHRTTLGVGVQFARGDIGKFRELVGLHAPQTSEAAPTAPATRTLVPRLPAIIPLGNG